MSRVAIVVRTKNEERWISRCLKMIFSQAFTDFEVVIVDNNSSDHTVDIARRFPVTVVTIDEFRPGLAINAGVRATQSEFIACLSAHCIPRDQDWLGALVRNMERETIAGVYGRQLPFSHSSDLNKRDLLITFGLDHRVQTKDSFFHNANSLVRRSVWDRIPFDEHVSNIEDRLWGQAVVDAGYQIAYEPEAAVYHYHGIHQDQNEDRARKVVRIMEALHGLGHEQTPEGFGPGSMSVLAILPVLGPVATLAGENLLSRCIRQVRAAQFVTQVAVIAEDGDAQAVARECGALVIDRPAALGGAEVSVEQVLQHAVHATEARTEHVDAVVYVNYLYPFRPPDFFDELVVRFTRSGVDTVVPSLKDYQPTWMEAQGKLVRVDTGLLPRDMRAPLQKGIVGLGCITSSEFLRQGRLFGESIDLIPFDEMLYALKVSDPFSRAVAAMALEQDPLHRSAGR